MEWNISPNIWHSQNTFGVSIPRKRSIFISDSCKNSVFMLKLVKFAVLLVKSAYLLFFFFSSMIPSELLSTVVLLLQHFVFKERATFTERPTLQGLLRSSLVTGQSVCSLEVLEIIQSFSRKSLTGSSQRDHTSKQVPSPYAPRVAFWNAHVCAFIFIRSQSCLPSWLISPCRHQRFLWYCLWWAVRNL